MLYTDNNFILLRRKIALKFISKIQLTPQKTSKGKNSPSPANIKRLPPPIPAKTPKEVNKISKFFKSSKLVNSAANKSKSYTQASKQNASTADVIKIKETFTSVGAKEINQINNIIKGPSKPKCYNLKVWTDF